MNWNLLTLPLTFVLILWVKKRAGRPTADIDGWRIVRWSAAMRCLPLVISVAVLAGGVISITGALEVPRESAGTLVAIVLLFIVLLFSSLYGVAWFWRNWVKYNGETLVNNTPWDPPQTFKTADLRFTGNVTYRGREFTTLEGDTVYINSFCQGGQELIDLLSRQ